mgnify:CR=1 FL=1|jgi:hypothetical protein
MVPISRVALRIYGAGIAVSGINQSVRSIEDMVKYECKYHPESVIPVYKYTMESFVGFILGSTTGLFWPIGLVGYGTYKLFGNQPK